MYTHNFLLYSSSCDATFLYEWGGGGRREGRQRLHMLSTDDQGVQLLEAE